MKFKNILSNVVLSSCVFIGGSNLSSIYNSESCDAELDLVEFSINRFDDLSAKNFKIDILNRKILEDKIDTALVISASLNLLDRCRINSGVENYSVHKSVEVQNLSSSYLAYSSRESAKLYVDVFKLLEVEKSDLKNILK